MKLQNDKRIRRYAVLFFIILTVAATGCTTQTTASANEASAPPELILRYADNQAEDYPTTQAAYYFAQLVEEKTGGRIQIKVYGSAQLGDEQSVVRQVRFGGIDFARVSVPSLSQLNPSIDILQMPFLYDDAAHMWRVLDGEIGDEFLASLEEADIIGLSWYDAGARSFYASKPIRSLEDLNGMRIRVQENPLMENTVRAFGAIPVPMIFSQVLSALQTGEVDAAENNLPSYESMKHYRVAPYFYRDEHFRTPEVQLMSASAWDALSEEDRNIIRECALASAKYQRELWRAKEQEAEKAVLLVGSTIENASPEDLKAFREAVSELYDALPAKDMETIERIRSLGSHAEG